MSMPSGVRGSLPQLEVIISAKNDSFINKIESSKSAIRSFSSDADRATQGAAAGMDRYEESAEQAAATTQRLSIDMKGLVLSMSGMATSAIGIITSMSNLDRAAQRVEKSHVAVARAEDLLATTQARLNKMVEAGQTNTEQYRVYVEKLQTAYDDLRVKTEDVKLAQDALGDTQILFATTIANTFINSAFLMTSVLKGFNLELIKNAFHIGTQKTALVSASPAIHNYSAGVTTATGVTATFGRVLQTALPPLLAITAGITVWEALAAPWIKEQYGVNLSIFDFVSNLGKAEEQLNATNPEVERFKSYIGDAAEEQKDLNDALKEFSEITEPVRNSYNMQVQFLQQMTQQAGMTASGIRAINEQIRQLQGYTKVSDVIQATIGKGGLGASPSLASAGGGGFLTASSSTDTMDSIIANNITQYNSKSSKAVSKVIDDHIDPQVGDPVYPVIESRFGNDPRYAGLNRGLATEWTAWASYTDRNMIKKALGIDDIQLAIEAMISTGNAAGYKAYQSLFNVLVGLNPDGTIPTQPYVEKMKSPAELFREVSKGYSDVNLFSSTDINPDTGLDLLTEERLKATLEKIEDRGYVVSGSFEFNTLRKAANVSRSRKLSEILKDLSYFSKGSTNLFFGGFGGAALGYDSSLYGMMSKSRAFFDYLRTEAQDERLDFAFNTMSDRRFSALAEAWGMITPHGRRNRLVTTGVHSDRFMANAINSSIGKAISSNAIHTFLAVNPNLTSADRARIASGDFSFSNMGFAQGRPNGAQVTPFEVLLAIAERDAYRNSAQRYFDYVSRRNAFSGLATLIDYLGLTEEFDVKMPKFGFATRSMVNELKSRGTDPWARYLNEKFDIATIGGIIPLEVLFDLYDNTRGQHNADMAARYIQDAFTDWERLYTPEYLRLNPDGFTTFKKKFREKGGIFNTSYEETLLNRVYDEVRTQTYYDNLANSIDGGLTEEYFLKPQFNIRPRFDLSNKKQIENMIEFVTRVQEGRPTNPKAAKIYMDNILKQFVDVGVLQADVVSKKLSVTGNVDAWTSKEFYAGNIDSRRDVLDMEAKAFYQLREEQYSI